MSELDSFPELRAQKKAEPTSQPDSSGPADLPVVLITNDDGIDAPGLRALVSALVEGGRCDVNVCAPDSDRSATGHCITYRDNLVAEAIDIPGVRAAFQLSGTPADCASLALSGALFSWSNPKPTLVISGINKGSNSGIHIFYSGTVAGAREAYVNGVPAIALSLAWIRGKSGESDYRAAAEVSLPLIYATLRDLKEGVYPEGCFFNVDIPTHPLQHKGYKVTKQGTSRMAFGWKSVTAQRRMRTAREMGAGAQLAQLGLEASAAGARRQNSLGKSRSTPAEIESVGAAVGPNGSRHSSSGSEKLEFRLQTDEMEYGELGDHDNLDFGALQQGFITVTPLGLLSFVAPETRASVSTWVSSAAL